MMWLFAVLIVLAMAGVAAVAAGKGAPLTPAYDDRPDADVPASGLLSADDLRRVRFSVALRGYRMSEVDALLDRLAREREDPGDVQGDPGHHSGHDSGLDAGLDAGGTGRGPGEPGI